MEPIRVLLVEDNPADARLVSHSLEQVKTQPFRIAKVEDLQTALHNLDNMPFDVMLLDLSLPDSHGLETVRRAHSHAPDVAIIVLTGYEEEAMGVQSLRAGAQDYLIKGQANGALLTRSMQYAIERQRLQEEVRALSLTDELTGLHNRRGFMTLMEQQRKQLCRTAGEITLLFLDLDNMKAINDTFGHEMGDRALREIAGILRSTFRQSDILARLGGDEFVVAALTTAGMDAQVLVSRLEAHIEALNQCGTNPFTLSLSIGTTRFSCATHVSLEEVMNEADAMMYLRKREKKQRLTAVVVTNS